MPAPQLLGLLAAAELLERVLPDRLEHEEAVVPDRLQQAVVDERGELVDARVADLLRRLERERACEHRQAGEQRLRRSVEQVVAPLDRRAQRALALRGVARTSGEERESHIEPLEELLGSQQLRSSGCELDGKWETVEAAADRFDRRVRRELPADRARPLDEERRRVRRGKRLEPVLALAGHVQRRPARDEHAQALRGREERAHRGRAVEQVLEVVEEDEELPVSEEAREVVRGSEHLRELRMQELRIRQACERNPEHSIAQGAHQLRADLQSEPGLAGATGPGEREEARAVREQPDELLELALPPDERARGDRQVRRVERPERRELAVA